MNQYLVEIKTTSGSTIAQTVSSCCMLDAIIAACDRMQDEGYVIEPNQTPKVERVERIAG